jgi:hypothetical protein
VEAANQFHVSVLAGGDPTLALRTTIQGLPAVRVPSGYPVVSYPLTGAHALYGTGAAMPEEPQRAPAWASESGQGFLIHCGVPAAFGADGAAGAELVRSLARYACGRLAMNYQEGPLVVKRGACVAAHALGRTVSLHGEYLDLLAPEMPLVENPALPYREPVVLKQVKLAGRAPSLLHGTHRTRVVEASPTRTRLEVDGPEGSPGVLRLFPAGMSLAAVTATDAQLNHVEIDAHVDGRTLRVRYAQRAAPIQITITWIRPEARLTK